MKHECEHNSRWFMGVTGVLHRDTTSVTNNIDDCSVPCVPVNRDSVTDCVLPETEVNGNGIQPSSTYFNLHLWLSYCDLSSVKKGQLRIIHKMSILAAKCQMASVWLYILKGALCSLGEEISIRRDLWVVLIDRITFMPKQLNKLILKQFHTGGPCHLSSYRRCSLDFIWELLVYSVMEKIHISEFVLYINIAIILVWLNSPKLYRAPVKHTFDGLLLDWRKTNELI